MRRVPLSCEERSGMEEKAGNSYDMFQLGANPRAVDACAKLNDE